MGPASPVHPAPLSSLSRRHDGFAELAQFPSSALALVARLPLLAQLADFQRALNEEFDNCRHGARYRPALALQRLGSGIALLCRLQEELLHPALGASRADAWPALGRAMADVDTLRELAATGERTTDTQQRSLVTLLEGLVQLHFASLDALLAEADAAAMPWAGLTRETEAALATWQVWQARQARHRDAEDAVLEG